MNSNASLPPLREVIARHGLSASKALGQNFILDRQLLARIAAIPGPQLLYYGGGGQGNHLGGAYSGALLRALGAAWIDLPPDGGARLVQDEAALGGMVAQLLAEPDLRQRMAEAAAGTVGEMRGALGRRAALVQADARSAERINRKLSDGVMDTASSK